MIGPAEEEDWFDVVITWREDLPQKDLEVLGFTHSDRINNLIVDLCANSEGKDTVELSPEFSEALLDLRSFLFRNVYHSPDVRTTSDLDKVEKVITSLYEYFLAHPDEIQGIYRTVQEEEGTHAAVKDWIAGMTDRYALEMYEKLFVPQGWRQF